MNKFIWLGLIIIILISSALIFMSFSMRKIETPQYKVLKTFGDVELRLYPKMVVAKTNLNDASFENQGNTGFRTIANYIFGGNEKNEKIAMTAPVVMNLGDTASMYFVMPKSYDKETLPAPNSKQVQIVEEDSKVLAVITYGGFSSDEKIKKYAEELRIVLTKNGIQTRGAFLYMGYNAPWDLINRKNEVGIEVEYVTAD
jgi:hypothetical protein